MMFGSALAGIIFRDRMAEVTKEDLNQAGYNYYAFISSDIFWGVPHVA